MRIKPRLRAVRIFKEALDMLEAVDRLIAEIKETGGTMTESTEREGGD